MGTVDEGNCNGEIEIGVKLGKIELDFKRQPETVAIEDAVKVLLHGLGEDVDREGIRKTPFRVAKALREGTKGYKQQVKDIVQGALFPEAGLDDGVGRAGGVGGLVIVRDLDFFSYCESCLLPFQVKCHVGYVPSGQQVLGLSKLSRVADVFARRLQEPQRLADEVCSALHRGIKPSGVAVLLQCLHIEFPNVESVLQDSTHSGWTKSQVCSGSGLFGDDNAGVWGDFLSLLQFRGINVETKTRTGNKCWCPSQSHKVVVPPVPVSPGMVDAVTLILRSLGEDPLRKELIHTPTRFVKWFMNFKNTNLEVNLNGFVPNGVILNQNGQTQMHSELNLSFWSQCEHHLLPFHGVVHIGYFSTTEGLSPAGKSLLQSIVHFYGFKLQVQERLTRQIAETVSSLLGGDVMVVVEASHTCMISRGIEKFGSSTATIAVLGRFSTDPSARAMFLKSIPNSTTSGI